MRDWKILEQEKTYPSTIVSPSPTMTSKNYNYAFFIVLKFLHLSTHNELKMIQSVTVRVNSQKSSAPSNIDDECHFSCRYSVPCI